MAETPTSPPDKPAPTEQPKDPNITVEDFPGASPKPEKK